MFILLHAYHVQHALFRSVNITTVDTFACSVPDIMANGGNITDEALQASASVIINCMNRLLKSRKRRKKAGQQVGVSEIPVSVQVSI